MDEIKQYWQQLNPRERLLLGVAGVVLGLMILFLGILEPVMDEAKSLEKQVEEQRKLLKWMEDSAQEVKRLTRSSGTRKAAVGAGGQSLLGVIDRTAKAGNLGDAMKRVEPDGGDKVRVWLEQASFDDVVTWLENLERNYSLQIESVAVDKENAPGRVNVRLVFAGGAS
ncbi:MAG: type II secretion system protein M [Gammaproteobacteria bacterium]|nr:type II secretion system protein M [Gammaproteobacteria bacterium]